MPSSTLTSKGQVTIPKSIREKLHLRAGDRLDFTLDATGRVIVEHATHDIRELRGLLHRPDRAPISVEQMNEAVRQHVAEKFARIPGGKR